MIERTFDYRRVKKIAGFPLTISREVIYLIDKVKERDLGLWSFFKREDGSYVIHADMQPEFRGRKAVESAKKAFKWIFENTKATFIKAEISRKNMKACRVASWSGMKDLGLRDDFRHFKVMR